MHELTYWAVFGLKTLNRVDPATLAASTIQSPFTIKVQMPELQLPIFTYILLTN